MTEHKAVAAIVVLDRSGSMGVIRDATVEGLGKYIADLKTDEDAENLIVSLLQFDHEFEWVIKDKKVTEIRTLPPFEPRGHTCLNDALAKGITAGDAAEEQGRSVLLVVVTDGAENSSTEYGGPEGTQRIKDMLEERQDNGWVVTYLSADPSSPAWKQAAAYGISAGNAIAYSSNAGSTAATWASIGNVTKTVKRSSSERLSKDAFAMSGVGQDLTSATAEEADEIRSKVWDVDRQEWVDPE